MVIIPYKDPEKARQNKREYYIKNCLSDESKETKAIYDKEYRLKNIEKLSANRRQYHAEHREQENSRNTQYNKDHKEDLAPYFKQYRIDNKEKVNAVIKKWAQEHPERKLASHKRHLNKIGALFNLNWTQYAYALMEWSQAVRRAIPLCVCGSPAKHSHHIFPKAEFPELSLEIWNGRSVCIPCHKGVHSISLTKFEKVDEVIE